MSTDLSDCTFDELWQEVARRCESTGASAIMAWTAFSGAGGTYHHRQSGAYLTAIGLADVALRRAQIVEHQNMIEAAEREQEEGDDDAS